MPSCEIFLLWCENMLSLVWKFFAFTTTKSRKNWCSRGENLGPLDRKTSVLTPKPTGIYTEEAPYRLHAGWDYTFQTCVEIFCLWCGNASSLVWKCVVFVPILQNCRNKKFPTKRQKNLTPETKNVHFGDILFLHQFGKFSFSFLFYNRNEKCSQQNKKVKKIF